MFIWNKNRHFNKITEEFYNRSMADIRELERLLNSYGAKPYIEKNTEKFITASFLYLLYFQECALHTIYASRYRNAASRVTFTLAVEIAGRFHYIPQKYSEAYVELRRKLSDLAFDERFKKVGIYYAPALSYLQTVFSGEYNPEDVGIYDDRVECALANFFQTTMKHNMEYLKGK